MDCSVYLLLQYFFVCAFVVYVRFVLSLFVHHLSFCASGGLYFVIMAFSGYLYIHFALSQSIIVLFKGGSCMALWSPP